MAAGYRQYCWVWHDATNLATRFLISIIFFSPGGPREPWRDHGAAGGYDAAARGRPATMEATNSGTPPAWRLVQSNVDAVAPSRQGSDTVLVAAEAGPAAATLRPWGC